MTEISLNDITLELDKRKGEKDVAYFIEHFLYIRDILNTDGITVPFNLFPSQKQALQSIIDNRLNIILKARQLGLTWLALGWSTHKCFYNHGITGLITSRAEIEVMELMNRYDFMFRNAPQLFCNFKDKSTVSKSWNGVFYEKTALSIRLFHPDDESRIIGFPSNKNSGISFTGSFWIADEWAKQDYAEEIFTSIFPAVNNPNSKFIGLSTITRGSFFEQKWIEDNNFNKIFLPWSADPRRDQKWYDDTLETMKERMTSEYPATIEEALTVPGGAYFPEYDPEIHTINSLDTAHHTNYISLDYGLDMCSAHWIAVYDNGNAIVYREIAISDLNAEDAAELIKKKSENEPIALRFAAKDLWSRKATGPTIAETFERKGVPLFMVSNSVENGCNALKTWLKPQQTDGKNTTRMRLFKGACPQLEKSLKNIQKDKNNPNIYSKTPHHLTHFIDDLRYYASGRPVSIQQEQEEQEDYSSLFNYGR